MQIKYVWYQIIKKLLLHIWIYQIIRIEDHYLYVCYMDKIFYTLQPRNKIIIYDTTTKMV